MQPETSRLEAGSASPFVRDAIEPQPRIESGDDGASVDGRLAGGRTPTKEREFRDGFLRRQREDPGWLEREAAAVLGSEVTNAEKVALLRALEDVGSSELGAWLEHTVRSCPDESSSQGVSLPTYALLRLQRLAPRDPAVREGLMRLGFETPALSPALRRSAAAMVASLSSTEELPRLERALRSEREPEVLSSAVAALGARSGEGAVARILARNGWEPVESEPTSPTILE